MDNLLFAKGAPPGKDKFQGCTPGYPASLYGSNPNWSTDSDRPEKVVQFESESAVQFTLEQVVQIRSEVVVHFASEWVVEFRRNTQEPLRTLCWFHQLWLSAA
jgi:hypothetical protein